MVEVMDEFVRKYPQNPEGYILRGKIQEKNDDCERAEGDQGTQGERP